MCRHKAILVSLITLFFCAPLTRAEVTTWTSRSGANIDAEFVRLSFGQVMLKKADGSETRIALNQLSSEDQVRIQKLASGGSPPKDGQAATGGGPAEIPPELKSLFGKRLYRADKSTVSTAELADKKRIGIYFSAYWCPPCRAFTPKLVDFHKKMTKAGKPFEIVFVSSDRDKASMYHYMEDMGMPWLATKWNSKVAKELKSRFGIRGVPALVIIDNEGQEITRSARRDVISLGTKAYKKW